MQCHQILAQRHRAADSDRVQTWVGTTDTRSSLSSHTSAADIEVLVHWNIINSKHKQTDSVVEPNSSDALQVER